MLVGDNIYGSERPQDFKKKFEDSLQAAARRGCEVLRVARQPRCAGTALLQALQHGRQAVLHVQPEARHPVLRAREHVSGSGTDRWLEKELKASGSNWKIVLFHHPLYSSGDRHGSDLRLREVLEPLFLANNISVVLTGHDHFYERVKPQNGITYFVVGSGGKLRSGNIDRSTGITAKGFDTDLAFMAAEIAGDEMYFNTVSRTGQTIDSGVLYSADGRALTAVPATVSQAREAVGTGSTPRHNAQPSRHSEARTSGAPPV